MDHFDLKKFFRNKDIKKYMAALFVAGILLMAFSSQPLKIGTSGFEEGSTNKKTDEIAQEGNMLDDDIENRLEDLFENIEGAGKVKVMITYKSGPEKIVATDTRSEESSTSETESGGVGREIKSVSGEVNTVILGSNSSGGGDALVVKEKTPEIEGIVVVAQGGGDANVKNSISKAAQALFDIPAHKVEVLKMGE